MTRLHFILYFILFIFSIRSSAQFNEADSLLKIIPTLPEDSVKVNTLINLGNAYFFNTDISDAIEHGTSAKELAKKIKYARGLGFSCKLLGQAYAKRSNFSESLNQFKEALKAFESIHNKDGISNILNNIGSVYFNIGEDAQSIEYHLQSMRVAEEIGNKQRIGTNLNNIGSVYFNKPVTLNKALEYYYKALAEFNGINYADGIATASMNIGEIYFIKAIYDSALTYFNTSIKIYDGTADVAFALSYVAEIYAQQNEFAKALTYHQQAIDITEKLGAKLELAQSLISLAKTQRKNGNLTLSISNYEKALAIGKEIRARQEIKKAFEALSVLYAQTNDFKNAYLYESLLTQVKDTLYNSAEDKKIQQLQFNFDLDKKEAEIELHEATIQRQKIVSYAIGISGFLLLLLAIVSYNRYKFVGKTNKIIKEERDRSKELLLNILPEETAHELETNGHATTRFYENVTVLFTDFKGFSTIAGKLSPQDLVAELNDYFMAFDDIVEEFHLEKIKTIGDAYMCAGGIPSVNQTHPLNAVQAALAMQIFMENKNRDRQKKGVEGWELRIGIHTGPVVAGVVGKKKYAYDIWGDTVNIASRMESNGEPGKVNISSSTYHQIKEQYQCLYRGKISAKNIGDVDMYFIESEITKLMGHTA